MLTTNPRLHFFFLWVSGFYETIHLNRARNPPSRNSGIPFHGTRIRCLAPRADAGPTQGRQIRLAGQDTKTLGGFSRSGNPDHHNDVTASEFLGFSMDILLDLDLARPGTWNRCGSQWVWKMTAPLSRFRHVRCVSSQPSLASCPLIVPLSTLVIRRLIVIIMYLSPLLGKLCTHALEDNSPSGPSIPTGFGTRKRPC